MTDKEILEIHILERKKFNLLNEVLDLSKQIGQSMDRNDQVSLRMLLGLRQEPIEKLEELKIQLASVVKSYPTEEAEHLKKVLGGRASNNKPEEALKNQALATKKLLEQVLALDERINRKITGEESIYLLKN